MTLAVLTPTSAQALAGWLEACSAVGSTHLITAGPGEGPAILDNLRATVADVVVLDMETGPGIGPALRRYRSVSHARVVLLAVGRRPGDAEVAAALQAGAQDVVTDLEHLEAVLTAPAALDAATSWLGPIPPVNGEASAAARPAPASARQHQVCSVGGLKGGVGKTTVAQNVALAAVGLGQQVLIVNLDPQSHSFDHSLGCRGNRKGLSLALRDPTPEVVRHAVERRFGLDVLTRGDTDGLYVSVDSEDVRALLRAVRPSYDLVIVDTAPAVSDPGTFVALEAADTVYVVMDHGDPGSVQDAASLCLLGRELGRELAHWGLVLNREQPLGRPIAVLEAYFRDQGVNCPIIGRIPNDPARYGRATARQRPAYLDCERHDAGCSPWQLLASHTLGATDEPPRIAKPVGWRRFFGHQVPVGGRGVAYARVR